MEQNLIFIDFIDKESNKAISAFACWWMEAISLSICQEFEEAPARFIDFFTFFVLEVIILHSSQNIV